MTHPLPFTWPYALPYWLAYVWSFLPERKFMKTTMQSEADASSVKIILIGMQAAMAIAFFVSFFVPQFAYRFVFFWIGIAVTAAGSLLRRHCFRILGEYFTYAVQVVDQQPVIDRGAYRWVRHPSYTGGMLMFIGIGLSLANWVSLALLTVMSISVYSYRVVVEERALAAKIGEPYRAFMARRKRFIPFVI